MEEKGMGSEKGLLQEETQGSSHGLVRTKSMFTF